ncbi:MAG: hypothetical protein U0166_08660 [Acidobacteriota bacterium]
MATLYRSLIVRAAEFGASTAPRPRASQPELRPLGGAPGDPHVHDVRRPCAGIAAAASFAEEFGETERAARYRSVARDMRAGMDRYLWSAKHGRFLRMIVPRDDGTRGDHHRGREPLRGVRLGAYPRTIRA